MRYCKTSLSEMIWSTCFIWATLSFFNTFRAHTRLFSFLFMALYTLPKPPIPTTSCTSKSVIFGFSPFIVKENFSFCLVGLAASEGSSISLFSSGARLEALNYASIYCVLLVWPSFLPVYVFRNLFGLLGLWAEVCKLVCPPLPD